MSWQMLHRWWHRRDELIVVTFWPQAYRRRRIYAWGAGSEALPHYPLCAYHRSALLRGLGHSAP
jgi:hypothetical protein